MSAEPNTESIATSSDRRSKRPTKKRALTPVSEQAANVDALFAKPDQEIRISGDASNKRKHHGSVIPEIVTNVQGSSAGAGSGEFHVYKASRRREYERLRQMDEEVRRERETGEFERAREERERRDDEKTRRNREKREKMKARKAKAKGGQQKNGESGGATVGPKVPKVVVTRQDDSGNHGKDGDTEVKDAPDASTDEPQGIVIEED